MKKNYFFILLFLVTYIVSAQRSVKIGYIDTEYILENLPEYNQVSDRLEEKAAGWKKEIEEEITLDEEELSEYQQKRFGPRGDLIIQKQQLIQPIQDQIFNAIRELAESKNYDFIFDKSADIVMLYSDRRFDVSEQILRTITRANKRKKLDSRKDKREIENQSLIDDESALISDLESREKENNKEVSNEKQAKKLTVKELLEQRKQKNSNKRKVKD